ncbi:TPA: hypothetical protein DEP94_01520 [Candidatus Nomurabacteria bacterium]|nr:hypothetical protein [Candidatus Nomurabacteria bacterium]
MKKALLSFSIIVTSFMVAGAQFSGTIGGTINGNPVVIGVGGGNGGSALIGQQVSNGQVGGSLISLIQLVQNIVYRLVPLGIGMAVVALFFGIIMFLVQGRDDEKKRKSWLFWMMYSVLGLFVMVAIWGLVGFLASVLGVGVGGSAPTPTIPYVQ